MKVLTDTLINLFRCLRARVDARRMISVEPLGDIFWEDEMPESAAKRKLSEEEWKEEWMTLWWLFVIRCKIWDGESLSPDDQALWDSARAAAPAWALFHRLALTDADRKAREGARAEVESTCDVPFGAPVEIEITEKDPGLCQATAKGLNKKHRETPRIQ